MLVVTASEIEGRNRFSGRAMALVYSIVEKLHFVLDYTLRFGAVVCGGVDF